MPHYSTSMRISQTPRCEIAVTITSQDSPKDHVPGHWVGLQSDANEAFIAMRPIANFKLTIEPQTLDERVDI